MVFSGWVLLEPRCAILSVRHLRPLTTQGNLRDLLDFMFALAAVAIVRCVSFPPGIPCAARFGNDPPSMASKPVYIKATFETPAGLADEAAGILVANGALGCAVERGGRAGPKSRRPVKLEAYFTTLRPAKLSRDSAHDARGRNARRFRSRCAPQSIVDPGWATMWQSRFEPLPIGERFLIVPPWNRATEPGRISITVLPGQAFGTGHHPTTSGALTAIEDIIAQVKNRARHRCRNRLGNPRDRDGDAGARKIVAIDNDGLALDNARENAEFNRGDATHRILHHAGWTGARKLRSGRRKHFK